MAGVKIPKKLPFDGLWKNGPAICLKVSIALQGDDSRAYAINDVFMQLFQVCGNNVSETFLELIKKLQQDDLLSKIEDMRTVDAKKQHRFLREGLRNALFSHYQMWQDTERDHWCDPREAEAKALAAIHSAREDIAAIESWLNARGIGVEKAAPCWDDARNGWQYDWDRVGASVPKPA